MDRPLEPSRDRSALSARPGDVSPDQIPMPGQLALGLEPARDTLLYVPAGLQPGQRVPLVIWLHGAGGEAAGGLSLLLPLADTGYDVSYREFNGPHTVPGTIVQKTIDWLR